MAGQEGYSTSKDKRGGGEFRTEASVRFNYSNFDRSLDQANKYYANMVRALKSNKNIKIKSGKAQTDIAVVSEWRKTIKYGVRSLATDTTAYMKQEMLDGIGGRIVTNTMKGNVKGRTDPSKAAREVSRVGWLDLWYKYFGFQEEGTQTGIKPMKSIVRASVKGRLFAAKGLAKLSRDLRSAGKGSVRRG
jgi:hypothetical protein